MRGPCVGLAATISRVHVHVQNGQVPGVKGGISSSIASEWLVVMDREKNTDSLPAEIRPSHSLTPFCPRPHSSEGGDDRWRSPIAFSPQPLF